MPGFIEPCDPTLQERAPTGNEWVYEIKTDGYRAQVHLRDKRVTIYSRSGHDWADEFAPIAKAASKLKVHEAIIDGGGRLSLATRACQTPGTSPRTG
jgi:bifunctional non-homologous end joining protein LigD